MPGSQRIRSIDVAYFFNTYRWFFRGVFGLLALMGIYEMFKFKLWVAVVGCLLVIIVTYATNYLMAADTMFYQPETLSLKDAKENKVKTDRVVLGVTINGASKAYPISMLVYYQMMKNFFPHVLEEYKALIETQYKKFNTSKINADELTRSKKYGQAVAKAVFDFSLTDAVGSKGYLNNQPADYVAPTGAGKWQPSYPDYGKALLPYWGKSKSFVINESEKLSPPPIAYSNNISSAFFFQNFEVHQITTPLTYEQKWIGEFWSDDIYKLTFEPSGRWIAIAQQVVRKEKVSLEKAIYTYAKVSIGLSDAGLACWNSKYVYNVERPITYIRREINPTWVSSLNNPLVKVNGVTPPFPAYPSGHSTFGGVAAEILNNIYGKNYALTDRCHEGRTEFIGTPRSFKNFDAMADENAYSRIPLGVHYRMDCSEGLRLGYQTGKAVNRLAWKK